MTTSVGLARPLLAPLPPMTERAAQPPPEAPAGPQAGANRPIGPNPSLRFEPTLGLVVFELRDSAGEVTRSVPTERELRAYRTAALRGDDAPDAARNDEAPPTGAAGQTRNPPGGSPSSASASVVAEEGAPKAPADSPARLIR
jgi:hypothetical protein